MSPSTESSIHSDATLPLRCVVLHHRVPEPATDHPLTSDTVSRGDHLDWMFEVADGGELWTFATPVIDLNFAKLRTDHQIPMTRLPDHRRRYLDYEGPISNNRGSVTQIARGTHRVVTAALETDAERAVFRTSVGLERVVDSVSSSKMQKFQLTFQRDHWNCDSDSSERVRKMAGVVWDGFLTIQR